jgi:hypothetical protein
MPRVALKPSSVPFTALKPTHPVSFGGFAKLVGVPRQRIYNMAKRNQIKSETIADIAVIMPAEAARLLDAAIRVDTNGGSRLVFDFI